MLMFLSRPASHLAYMGPFRKLRVRLPVEPGPFGKKAWRANGAVPTGFAPRMLVSAKPAGSGCVRSTPVSVAPVALLVAVAKSTLGLMTKTPFGVLKTPNSSLIWVSVSDEVAGWRAERPARLRVPRGSMMLVGTREVMLTIDESWNPPTILLTTPPSLNQRLPRPNGSS